LTSEPSHWDKILGVNVIGSFWLCQSAARQMQAQGGGKIINMASVTGLQPGPMMGIYSISKAAVIMLTRVLAVELAADNIQVNAIAPGIIKTRFSRALWDNSSLRAGIEAKTPAGRLGQPEEVCGLALYLASDASSFVTGGVFTVDGGYLLT
jgi:NAD(P)-dependent dehydrogenase (short-subunit alcohol dehydrogenase family)